jgi:hypothetical protein
MQVRTDKGPEDASTPHFIVSLFNAQTRKAGSVTDGLQTGSYEDRE